MRREAISGDIPLASLLETARTRELAEKHASDIERSQVNRINKNQ